MILLAGCAQPAVSTPVSSLIPGRPTSTITPGGLPTPKVLTTHTPNAQDALRRLPYRLAWDEAFRRHLENLATRKPLVFCGDLNVAHQEIDLARPRENRFCPGFSDEERASFSNLLATGFVDTFRHFHPDLEGAYSWWSYRAGARPRNIGWRIDYFGVSTPFIGRLTSASILPQIHGSDHCPVGIEIC